VSLKHRRDRGVTRVRFATEGERRVVTVEGDALAEIERRRLRRLLRPLPIRQGTVTVRTDWSGRRKVTFSREIPEGAQQVIRNILGNLARLRTL
jgi:Ribonuclease G/E